LNHSSPYKFATRVWCLEQLEAEVGESGSVLWKFSLS
jgi:hypothetical protein